MRMVRRIAVYGKGGIGKSTVSSNLTAALSDMGIRVMQIGCDPKHDSTRGLMGGREQTTVLDYLKSVPPSERVLTGVVSEGYKGCLCVEAGGPEPGIGCAGRGIISAFDLLNELGADSVGTDMVLYDVLGDVVCGGFAVPMRNGYADTVYIVTSGEFMSIYAANNILRGTSNYDPDRIGGIIFNSRGDPAEDDRVRRFSEAVGVPVVAKIGRSEIFMEAEKQGRTVVEAFPDSEVAGTFRELAKCVAGEKRYTAHFLEEHELEMLILGRASNSNSVQETKVVHDAPKKRLPYSSRNFSFGEPLGGCAFSGASATCSSVRGLSVILHSTRNCAHFTVQLAGLSTIGFIKNNRRTIPSYLDLDIVSTDMKESDMVFGGNRVLKDTLEARIAAGAKDIVVITGCAPGIMGDDVAEICSTAESEHPGVSVLLLAEDGNATGDYMQGVIDAAVGMLGKFSVRGKTVPDTVNLVGCKTMATEVMNEIELITGLMKEIGIGVNCVLPGVSDMESVRNAPNAAANLRMNTDKFSEKICNFLEDEYGMETLPVPVRGGLAGTREWIGCVASFFHKEKEAEELLARMEKKFGGMFSGHRSLLGGKRAVILSMTRDVSWILEAMSVCGVELEAGYVFNRPDYSRDLDASLLPEGFEIISQKDIPRVLESIRASSPDILMTMVPFDVGPLVFQARIPITAGIDPFAGKALMDSIARSMLAPGREGWRKDVAGE